LLTWTMSILSSLMPKLCPTWIHESDLPIPGLPLKNGTAVGDLSNILVATSTTWLIDGIIALRCYD